MEHPEVISAGQLELLAQHAADWFEARWQGDHKCPFCGGTDWDVRIASLALVQVVCQGCAVVVIADGQTIFASLPSG